MPELLKNLFNERVVNILAEDLKYVYPAFNIKKFNKLVFDNQWEKLELKQRMHHIALCLGKVLPPDYPEALSIIIKTAEERLPRREMEFADISLPDFVATFGLDHPEISIDALAVLTPYPTSEFGIRPFILKYPELTIPKFLEWSKSENHHVRRFASEGCRPRLPWGMAIPQFKKDPTPILPVLENLISDTSAYVRKSVANNLNDISKDNPEIFLAFAKKWFGRTGNISRLLKHASRTLLKKGDPAALQIFGFSNSRAEIKNLKLPAKIKIGEKLEFSFSLFISEKQRQMLRLEYRIYYVKSGGKLSPKIFSITENFFDPGKEYLFKRQLSFKDMTTRKHYKGVHKISVVINGIEASEEMFEVEM